MLYHFRYALTLWSCCRGMTMWEAWTYPLPNKEDRDDPVEDASSEISYMHEG